MKIDWLAKLRNGLQTLAFCLAIAAIKYAFEPHRPYEISLVYSICIGCSMWILIDFGRHIVARGGNSEWPIGPMAVVLPLFGIAAGYVIGILLGDSWFGWSSWSAQGRGKLPASILASAVAGISVTYYFHSRVKSSMLETQVSEASRQASEAKLKLLETQLEPHMLFNTLANLRVLIATDPQRAQDMLDRMVAYLRATLSASRASHHALQCEFDRLRDYLELMAVRMGSRLHYELDLPTDLANCSVPSLLLQPLVENSIKHGLEPKVEGGTITVRARRAGNMLSLEVSDTGVGFDNPATPSNGFGLAQVRERMAAAYTDRGSVEQTSVPGQGTSTVLRLPLTDSNA
ncbi:MAG: histidine kinase [Pseudomonadota bacterium]